MADVMILQHHPADAPGAVQAALVARGHSIGLVRLFDGDPVPASVGTARALVVMGGPMSVTDEAAHPFLTHEKKLLARALDGGLPVLGICLGAQLLATALGGTVTPGARKEIGFLPTTLTAADPLFEGLPETFLPFHWHGDQIGAVPDATILARSALTAIQAFRHGKSYGLQFHMESTVPMIDVMLSTFASELAEESLDPSAIKAAARTLHPAMERAAAEVFTRWVDIAVGAK